MVDIFKRVDTDNNGFITYDEFKIAAREDPTLTLFFNEQEPDGTCTMRRTEECENAANVDQPCNGKEHRKSRTNYTDVRYEMSNDGESYQFQA